MNGSPCTFTPDELKTAVTLYEAGTMVKDIGAVLGRNRSAVRDMLNFAGIKRGLGPRPTVNHFERCTAYAGVCKEEQRWRNDAIVGSGQLLEAMLRVGVRP